MYNLYNTIFYKELESRDTVQAKNYISYLRPLEKDMDVLLGYIRKLFPEFPDHGLQHSLRIMEYIGHIMSAKQLEDMSSLEIFIFIVAALFHDSGMALYNSGCIEELRQNHHMFAESVINHYFDMNFNNLEEMNRIKDVVIFICYAHGISLEELKACREFSLDCRINFERVRYGLLAFLLRIGDLMDIEGSRSNQFRMQMFGKDFSNVAHAHNQRHQKVKIYNYNPEEINIEVEADNIEQYKIWHDWFNYLEKDILCANTYLKELKYHFPCPQTAIVKSDGAKYDIQELRFEIDEEGSMWNIISESIYTNELDFVRELVQNAIDATLKRVYIDIQQELKYISPRSWNIGDNIAPVLVVYSEKKNRLYVIDQGIGMDQEDLHNFLFKVSSSGKVQCSKRIFDFPGIAQYGIGFVSCLINAEKINIFTSKIDEDNIHKVKLSSGMNVAFIENEIDSSLMGTVIELELKKQFTTTEIKNYLMKTFCYPSVDIQYVDLDIVEKVMNNIWDIDKTKQFIEKPYILKGYLDEIKTITEGKTKELLKYKSSVVFFEKKFREFKAYFQNEYISIISKRKIKEFNRFVGTLKALAPSENLKDKFSRFEYCLEKGLKKKDADKLFEYIVSLINEYTLSISEEKAKCDKKLEENNLNIEKINLSRVSIGQKWKYFAVFLDVDFNVYDLQYSDFPIDIYGKTGMILFKHYGEDYDSGIEYVAMNGFLFKNGQVYNRLARLTSYNEDYNDSYTQSFIIGLEDDEYDIREQVQEYIESQEYSDEDTDIIMHYDNGRYVPQNQFSTEYDVLHISDNKFMRINNADVFKIKNPIYGVSVADDERVWLSETIDRINRRENTNSVMEANMMELESCIHIERNAYYQDGIAITSRMNSLFPIGFFRIVCNCTAEARMKLNVTRHEASEIRTDIDEWIDKTGRKIQKMIYKSLRDMLEQEQLFVDYNSLVDDKEDRNYFEQKCLKSLKELLNEK